MNKNDTSSQASFSRRREEGEKREKRQPARRDTVVRDSKREKRRLGGGWMKTLIQSCDLCGIFVIRGEFLFFYFFIFYFIFQGPRKSFLTRPRPSQLLEQEVDEGKDERRKTKKADKRLACSLHSFLPRGKPGGPFNRRLASPQHR